MINAISPLAGSLVVGVYWHERNKQPKEAMAENNMPLDKNTVILRILVGVALVLVPLLIILVLGSFR